MKIFFLLPIALFISCRSDKKSQIETTFIRPFKLVDHISDTVFFTLIGKMSGVNEIAMLDVKEKRLIVCDKELKLKNVNQEITKTNYFHCFIRKSDQAVLCTDHYDLFKGILWHGEQMIGISEDQEYMLTYVIPGELFDYRDEMVKNYGQERLKSEFSQLNELCNSTKIDDNPVILYIKLKKDAESRK